MSRYPRSLRTATAVLAVMLACTTAPAYVRADRASDSWTGRVELRGSYYWERSTRVVAPTLAGRLESPNGVVVQGNYLVDSITSASVAAGALVDVGFTEIRHEGNLSVGGEIDVGSQHLTLTGSARYSHEPDYDSVTGTAAARLALRDRTTILGTSLSYFHDEVQQVFRTGSQIRPSATAGFDRSFDGIVLSLTAEHVVNARLVLSGGYDLGIQRGYLASPYRQVQVDGILRPESHPDARNRHTLYARAQLAVPRVHGALHLLVRGYVDDWDIRALTVESRWYQQLGDALLLRMRHRYYVQTASSFDGSSGAMMPTYTGMPTYFTADPKMQQFHDHEIGGALITRLTFFDESVLAWLHDSEIEFSFDYRFSTNRFGNAIIGAMSIRVPFH